MVTGDKYALLVETLLKSVKISLIIRVLQEEAGKKREGITYKIEDVPPW